MKTQPPGIAETKLNRLQIQYVLHLFKLTEDILIKYEMKDNLEVGLRGLQHGLRSYCKRENFEKSNVPLDKYLTWFIKSAIEKELGWNPRTTTPFTF